MQIQTDSERPREFKKVICAKCHSTITFDEPVTYEEENVKLREENHKLNVENSSLEGQFSYIRELIDRFIDGDIYSAELIRELIKLI